jgi:hypothetical protein
MTNTDLDRFKTAFTTILDTIQNFNKTLSPRDLHLMQIGMRASHIEEAMAHGEIDRARGHLDALVTLVKSI